MKLPNPDAVKRELARRKLEDFLRLDGGDWWIPGRHITVLCEHLEAIESGELERLIVEMPPRHGKSETSSRRFPAWFLGRNPDAEMILASYGAELAYDLSRAARETFREWGEALWGLRISTESSAMGRWGVEGCRGGFVAAGVGGALTGRGMSCGLVDDPLKGWAEATSKTVRDTVWNWYRSVFRTRLAPGGRIVLILTRWHEDDPAGRLIQEAEGSGEKWCVLRLPAIAEEDDPLGREPGEALWPERYPLDALEATRDALGSYMWAALYQQRPAPIEGLRFKRSWFRYFREERIGDLAYWVLTQPDGTEKRLEQRACWRFQTVDPAATEKDYSDYFVCSTWDVTPANDLLLVDVFREKAETTKHQAVMRQQYDRYQPGFQAVEKAFIGLNVIQECIALGLPVQELDADRDKLARSLPASARYEVGAVYHRQGAPWLETVEDELLDFPNGTHDDIVDTISYAGIQVAGWGGEVEILTGARKREMTRIG